MKEQNSLALLGRATQMLAEVKTIDDAKHLMGIAAAAKAYAKKFHLGKEAVLHASEIEVRAEIKLGEMLKIMKKNKGAATKRGSPEEPRSEPPTYEEIGTNKKEAFNAISLADLPEEEKEKVAIGKKSKKKAKKEQKQKKDEVVLKEAQENITIKDCDLRNCSYDELFASGIKPDAVITDPPYPKEYLHLYNGLAECCKNIPLVAVMCGQTYLPEIIQMMCKHLKYRWTLAYLTPGGQAVQQFPVKVNCFWKPVLLFGDALEWFGDVAASKVNDNDKRFHGWGQSESGMADLIERLTKPGQLICDPFLGGGTTAIASLALGRRFVGCDTNNACVKKTLQRARLCMK